MLIMWTIKNPLGRSSLHTRSPPPHPPHPTPCPRTLRSQKLSPAACLLSLGLSENLSLSLSVDLSSTPPAPAPPPPPLPRVGNSVEEPGSQWCVSRFPSHAPPRGGEHGGVPFACPRERKSFDRGSYFFLIYNPEVPCSRPRRPRAGAEQRVSRRGGFA